MIELRIMAMPDETTELIKVLKATEGLDIISVSNGYPNRGIDKRVRAYIKLEIKPNSQKTVDMDPVPLNENSETEIKEFIEHLEEIDPESIDELFFSTFCVHCKYLSKTEGANFLCKHSWHEIEDIMNHTKQSCPIYKEFEIERRKKCT